MKYGSAAAALITFGAAMPASAEMVTAGNPPSVVRALQAEGYQAKLGTDSQGDPKISSSTSGSSFEVYFYGCEKNKACTSIQFTSGYDSPDGKGPSPSKINEWNSKKRFATAWLDDENDPWLRMDVYTSLGGIPAEVFTGNLNMWTGQMADFEKHIGWGN